MTREDLDLHGCKLADLWHEAASWAERELDGARREQVLDLAGAIANGDPVVACYLGARVFDRLKYMGQPGDAELWLDELERRAVKATAG